MLAVLKVNLE